MGNIRHTFTSPLRHDHTCHLLYSTYSKYEEDWSSYPHTHYFTELFFVLSGSGSFLVEDETFPIAKHDLIVINPNITHTEKSSLEDPLEYIVLGVDGLNFVIDDANEYLLFHSDEMKDQLDFYFRTILEETENSQKDYEKVCQNLLNILVVHLSRYASSSVEIFPFHKMESRECSRAKEQLAALLHIPGLYRLVPSVFVKSTRSIFGPAAGFAPKELQTGSGVWRVDMMKCPYHDTCAEYGCPELCRCFCDSDDISYTGLHPKLIWERSMTLGRGNDRCDFCMKVR